MKKTLRDKDILLPSRNVNDLYRDYVGNRLGGDRLFYRAVVIAIDTVGGVLEQTPSNPRNSIKARLLTDSANSFLDNDDLHIFWPMFPYDFFPIKEGEHVYVLFEDENKQNGLWMTRIPEPNNVDQRNIVPGILKFQQANPDVQITERMVQDLDSDPPPITGSQEFVQETNPPPQFQARIGDRVIQGSNNTIIILGTDRSADVLSGQLAPDSGAILFIAGRQTEPDIDPTNDLSTIEITMNSDVDTKYNTPSTVGAGTTQNAPDAAVVIKSNQLRIIARNGMKIFVEGGDLNIDAKNINIGGTNSSGHNAVLGDQLVSVLNSLLSAIEAITVPTGVGPSGPPVNSAQFQQISQQLNNILSQTVNVKP